MILDSSAIIAIIREEPEAPELLAKIHASEVLGVSTPTLTETGIVLTACFKEDGRALLEQFMAPHQVLVIPFAEQHWGVALQAFARFGKGRHPAALNLGDCFSYATAKVAGEPLLYVGADFSQTDLERA